MSPWKSNFKLTPPLEGPPVPEGLREEYRHFHPEDRRRENHYGPQPGDTFLTPASITLTTGTSTSAVADLQVPFDGNIYTLNEANAATPGMNLEIAFANVASFRWVVSRLYYNGGSTHAIRVQLWNVKSSAWDTYQTYLGSGVDYETLYLPVYKPVNYVSVGAVKVRMYHTETGTTGHVLRIDHVGLID